MKDFGTLSDEELLTLLLGGDEAAFEEIFNRYWLKLYVSACKRVTPPEAAEEIVQDLFTMLWLKRESLQIHTSLAAYLFTSVRYIVINHLQKETVRKNYRNFVLTSEVNRDYSTEETILLNDLTRHIDKEVKYLPPKCRSVFELSRKENKTNREIAEFLGISEKTVEGHLTKAIRQLKLGLTNLSRQASALFF